MQEFKLIVSTVLVEFEIIKKAVGSFGDKSNILYITPNKLFPDEELKIKKVNQSNNYVFSSFADYLSDEEMEQCDKSVYDNLDKDDKSNVESLTNYYDGIVAEVNKLVMENLSKKYSLRKMVIISDGPGVQVGVWVKGGCKDLRKVGIAGGVTSSKPKSTKLQPLLDYLDYFNLLSNCSLIKSPKETALFFGSPERITKSLSSDVKVISSWSFSDYAFQTIAVAIIILKHIISRLIGINSTFFENYIILWSKFIKVKHKIDFMASSIHEYSKIPIHIKSHFTKFQYKIFQDSFVPENYTSKYLLYFYGVSEFLVWDKLSIGLFSNNNLKAKVSEFYQPNFLPIVHKSENSKKIVIASSSAGDWTALKNRSDDDKLAIAFVRVADQFPNIDFIFRAHPFMTKPELHGENAFSRLESLFKFSKFGNITLSKGIKKLVDSNKLSVPANSFESEINGALLVFGEHSFSMIEAGMKGIMWASVNVSGRRDLFQSYTKLGFYNLASAKRISEFIYKYQTNPKEILERYNKAALDFNTTWN